MCLLPHKPPIIFPRSKTTCSGRNASHNTVVAKCFPTAKSFFCSWCFLLLKFNHKGLNFFLKTKQQTAEREFKKWCCQTLYFLVQEKFVRHVKKTHLVCLSIFLINKKCRYLQIFPFKYKIELIQLIQFLWSASIPKLFLCSWNEAESSTLQKLNLRLNVFSEIELAVFAAHFLFWFSGIFMKLFYPSIVN